MKLKLILENAQLDGEAKAILEKADEMIYQMTANFDESIQPNEIQELIKRYFSLRRQGASEPMVSQKRGDYLAKQIVSYLAGDA